MTFDIGFFRKGLAQLYPDQECYSDDAHQALVENRIKTLVELVYKWNRTHNLTSITEPKEFIVKHLFDSLALLTFLQHKFSDKELNMLDIGSGAGFPGLPVAIFCSELQLTSIDANQKKIAFQNTAVRQLDLSNVQTKHARIEATEGPKQKIVTARAFSSILSIIESSAHLLCSSGSWLLMKGAYPTQELEALESSYVARNIGNVNVHALEIPFLDAERHLVEISAT